MPEPWSWPKKKRPSNWTGKGKTKNYRVDPNVDDWLAECCHVSPEHLDIAAALTWSWKQWCRKHQLDPGNRLHLGQQLSLRGFPHVNLARTVRCGIAVSDDA